MESKFNIYLQILGVLWSKARSSFLHCQEAELLLLEKLLFLFLFIPHIKSATTTAFVLFIWTMMPKIMNGQSRNLYHIVYSSFFSFLLHFNSTFKWICILLLPQKAGYAICSTKFTKIVLLTPILQYLPVFLSKTPSVLIITIVFREYNW